jgi:nitrate reductase (cytochrome), electron transfer subunit
MPVRGPLPVRVLAIVAMVAAMVVATLVLVPWARGLADRPQFPPVGPISEPGPPIAAEAHPYRTGPATVAAGFDVERRPEAHPRTLAIYRGLRAYPGAPPRIPHGLTDREFRENLCNSCHARGGFTPRFGTYAPVTPHPEYTDCLQCHAPDAMTVGLGIPILTADVICAQCHVDPDEPPPSLVSLDWQPMVWPQMGQSAMDGSPPRIPHGLQLREDCLACHGGPWAVQEIRTDHPERADCRSCHVPSYMEADPVFSRPLDASTGEAGGGP